MICPDCGHEVPELYPTGRCDDCEYGEPEPAASGAVSFEYLAQHPVSGDVYVLHDTAQGITVDLHGPVYLPDWQTETGYAEGWHELTHVEPETLADDLHWANGQVWRVLVVRDRLAPTEVHVHAAAEVTS